MAREDGSKEYPCLICENCGHVIGIKGGLEDAPDRFHVICPNCKHDGEYRKLQIRIGEKHRKQ